MDELLLVAGLRTRDEETLAVFLERYRSLFYHCISHFESEAGAREDLYQEIVLYALDRLDRDSFDPEKGSFGTWLYRVAWCRCVDLKRKQSARRAPKLVSAGLEGVPERADPAPAPGTAVAEAEVGALVRRGLATLDGEDRALLELRYVDGRTIGEISRQLSMSVEQAKYRLRRASVSLRRVLLNDLALEEAAE